METASIARGTLQMAWTRAVRYLIVGLFYIVVAKSGALTQTELGVLAILTFLASTFSLSTNVALPSALTKLMSENLGKNRIEEAAAIQKTVMRVFLAFSSVGFSIVVFFSKSLSQYFWKTSIYAPLIVLMIAYAFLDNLLYLYESYLQAFLLFGKMAIITIVFEVSTRATGAALAMLNLGVLGVSMGFIAGSLTGLSVALIFVKGKLPNPRAKAPVRPLLRFSFPLFLGSITLFVLSQVDIVILASVTSNYALVGIYSIVVKSIEALSIVWFPILVTIFPVLSARHGLQDPKGISKIVKTTTRYLSYAIFPSCTGLAIIAPTALVFFYGSDYTSGATPLAILSIATVLLAFSSVLATALTAIGKTGQLLKINIISAILSIVLFIVFAPLLEAAGVAFARLIVQAIGLMLAAYTLGRDVRVRIDKEAIFKSVLASVATIPFLMALEWTLSEEISVIQILAVEIFVATCVYLFSLYVLRALNSQDFELLKQAFPKALVRYINVLERIFIH